MTPLHINLMLHYHTTPAPYAERDPEHANSPAVLSMRAELIKWGLIEPSSDGTTWCSTEKGSAYVKHLCAVQVPIAQWVQP